MHSLAVIVWVGEHYLPSACIDFTLPTIFPYRATAALGASMHIALYAHHFYYMRTPPTTQTAARFLRPYQCIEESTGCGVMPQHLQPVPLQTWALECESSCTGGTKTASDTATTAPVPSTHACILRLPDHTLTTTVAQHWQDMGVLVRLFLHDVIPRPFVTHTNAKNILHMIIAALPSGGRSFLIKQNLAKVANKAPQSDSYVHPACTLLSMHDLLHIANHLALPVVIWRATDDNIHHTFYHCVLHSCSGTVTTVPWHDVQHVVHVKEHLVRVEDKVVLTRHMLTALEEYVCRLRVRVSSSEFPPVQRPGATQPCRAMSPPTAYS